MKERLQKCQQTERQRITFGKVSLLPLTSHMVTGHQLLASQCVSGLDKAA